MVEQFYEPPPTLKDRKENPLNEDWLTAAPIKSTEAGLGLVSQIESKVEPIAQTIDSFGSWQHLSTSGIIVITMILTWFITYFRFAFAWYFAVLWVISLVYSRNMTRFYKKVRNQALKDYSLNQIDVDQEKVEWFNQFLRRFWINYEPSLSASIKSVIDSSLEYYKPAFLEELVLTDFCLGSQAPRIEAIKTFAGTDDEMLIMDWDLTFMPFDDQSVSQLERNLRDLRNVSVVLKATLGVLPLTVAIKELYLSGRMRVQLKFFNGFPHIQSVDIGFVSTPSMDFKLVPLGTGDINKLGGLGDYIRTTVDGIVASILVNPVKMNFPIGAWFDASAGQTESPVGVLQITVAEAKGLKNKDVTGISDPATVIKLGGTEIARTRVIDNTLDPKWNEVFHVVIYKSTLTQLDSKSDELKFEVFHVAPIGSKSLGITSTLKLHKWIKLLELPEENTDGTQEELTKEEKENLLLEWGSPMETYSAEVWKKLVTPGKKSSGSLRINLSYFPVLGNGPVTNLDELNLSHKAGIVTVYVHQAKELMKAGIHSSVLECAAYFDGEEMFRTAHRKRTSNPSWESKHVFYCPDIGIANYNFKILNKGESIGEVKINLAHAIKATDDWYKLFGNPVGKVRISVKFSQLDAGQTMVDRTKTTNQEPLGLARITVLGAKDLENTEILGRKSDPYARVYLQGRNVGITAHRENTLAPVWNETFYTMAYSLKEQITMEVFDFNNLAKDKPLGKAELPIGPLLAFLNPDRSSLDMNQIGKFELDGLTVTVKEGQTLDVWAPIYLNTVIETDADMEENEPAPRDSLGKSFFKKTKANLTSFTQDIKTGKVRQKGHIHFELNLFHILQDYSVEAQDVLYVVRKSMNETPVQATLPLSPQDTHAETPTSLQEKSSSAVEAKEKIAEKPAATTDAAGRVSLVSTQIGSNESLAVVESNTANILEKVNAHRTGILSIKIKSGEFNRRVRPYVTISSVHGDEKVLFSTFAPPTAKSIVYWHAGNDRFITDIVSTKFVLYVRDQFGESPSDKDYILGVWKGDFVTELLGKKNNWVNFHQYSLRETDCEKLPITCRINLGFSFFPVELDVAVNDKYDTGVLQFDLLSAKNLPAVDSNGFSDPYCIITLNGNNVHKSKIHKKTLNPVFDERIYIDIYSRMKSTIDLHLKDYNQFTHNVSLGHCRIPLSTIVPDQVINITVPLDIGQGTVDICFIFQPKEIAKPLTSNVTESRLATETTALGKFGRGLTSQVTGLGSLMTGKKKSSGAVKSAISPLSSQDGLGALEHPEPPTDQTPKSYGLESRRPNRPKNADDDSQKPHAPPPIVENTAEKDEDTPLSLRAPEQDIKLVEDFIPGRNSATNMNSSTSVPDIRVKSPSPALPDVERASVASLRSISNGNKINFHIHSARGLQGVDRGGTSDPYVKVTAPDVKKSIYKTAVIKKSLNPIWHDEKFTVPSTTESLKFTVLDKNMISNDVELGYVDLNLVELLAHTDSVDEWFEMKGYSGGQVRISFEKIATDEPQPKRVSSNHSMYSGILKLGRKRASSNASQI